MIDLAQAGARNLMPILKVNNFELRRLYEHIHF